MEVKNHCDGSGKARMLGLHFVIIINGARINNFSWGQQPSLSVDAQGSPDSSIGNVPAGHCPPVDSEGPLPVFCCLLTEAGLRENK